MTAGPSGLKTGLGQLEHLGQESRKPAFCLLGWCKATCRHCVVMAGAANMTMQLGGRPIGHSMRC